MRLAISIGLVLCTTRVAAADRDDHPLKDLDLQVGVGFLGGAYGVGGVIDGADGPAIHAGWRHDRLLVLGEYNGLSVGGDDLEDGIIHRFGAAARWDLGYFGKHVTSSAWAGGILWGEAGVGWEHFGWDGGTRMDRSDLSFGLGGEYGIKFGGPKPRFVSIAYSAKLLVAKAPPATTVARLCVEGCGGAEPASRDLGIFFSAALTFGR